MYTVVDNMHLLGCIVRIAQMRPIATDVCHGRSVCDVTDRYPTKKAGPIEMPFGMWGGVDHSNQVLDGGLDPPTPLQGKWHF